MTSVVDSVREGYEAFARGDFAVVLDMLAPEVELHEEPEMPDRRTWLGREGVAGYFAETVERWRALEMEVLDVAAIDDTTVLVRGRLHGTGSISGATVVTPFAHLYETRDGRAARIRFFFEERHALEAAGLPAAGP